LNNTVFSPQVVAFARSPPLQPFQGFLTPFFVLALSTNPHRYACFIGDCGKHRGFPAFQSREYPGNINRISVFIVNGETTRTQAQYSASPCKTRICRGRCGGSATAEGVAEKP
jgi:hypothetical protein